MGGKGSTTGATQLDQVLDFLRLTLVRAWRHRWKVLLVSWLVCIVGWIVVQRIPDEYRVTARVHADVNAMLSAVLRNLAVDGSPQREVDVLLRTLLTRPNIERIVERTNLHRRVSNAIDREVLIDTLTRDIRIVSDGRAVYRIEFTDTDPLLAYDVVQAVLDLFMELAAAAERQQHEQAVSFVEQQIRNYERQLRAVEQRRIELRDRFSDVLPLESGGISRLNLERRRITSLRGELKDARERRALLAAQLREMQRAPPGARGAAGPDPRIVAAERTLRELLLRYTEEHPEVVRTRAFIAQLQAQGGRAATTAGEPPSRTSELTTTVDQLRLRILDLDAQIISLERQLEEATAYVARLEGMLRAAPDVQSEFAKLNRDYDVLQRNYQDLIARRESLQIAGAARGEADRMRIDVIEPPVVPQKPVAPNRVLLLSGVLVVGLGAGVALALLLAQFDMSFYSLRDLKRLGLPVLGVVSSANPPRLARAVIAFSLPVGLLFVVFWMIVLGVDVKMLADGVP